MILYKTTSEVYLPKNRCFMNDDFFEEEEDGIFGEDEVFDYIMLDEMEKKSGEQNGSGCLTSILLIISAIGTLGIIVVLKLI